jgi:RNA recognition motif-containing protein
MGTNLHIGNLSASVTEAELLDLFKKIGPVETATIMTNPETGFSQGIAFVRMTNESDAVNAISRLNFSQYDGQVISVSRNLRVNRDQK